MKRNRLVAAVLCLLLLCGCALAESGKLLDEIKEKGAITIATEGAWAPWTYHDESNALVGYDVEVARLVAKKLGVTPDFQEVEWDGIFAGLGNRFHIAANGVEMTDAREEAYDFSVPYAYLRTALIVRGDNDTITCFEDLKGKRTANSIASTYMDLAESYGASAVGVDTLDQTLQMVLAGRVDATLNAELSFVDYMKAHPEANLKVVALTAEASRVAIPLRKGEKVLVDAINQALTELAAEGELTRLSMAYFGVDISKMAPAE